ncbi:glycine cleavage system transcriptional repressor [Vibrio profundum]|uniref:glycine cleavage system protein R n=1 Tax=Vibrio profundum TaxID=2910247 RepID=UPI003D1477FB
MSQHSVITAIGTARPGMCHQIVRLVTNSGCNIIDSRIALFGSECTISMWITGNANGITRVETSLPLLGQQQDIITMMKRTSPSELPDQPYHLDLHVTGDDKLGLTEQFTQFFADRNISLASLSAQTEDGAKLKLNQDRFTIAISAELDTQQNLTELKQEFDALCQTLNVTGTLNFVHNTQ